MWRSLVARVVRDDEVAEFKSCHPDQEKDPSTEGPFFVGTLGPSAERDSPGHGRAPEETSRGLCRSPSAAGHGTSDLLDRSCYIGAVYMGSGQLPTFVQLTRIEAGAYRLRRAHGIGPVTDSSNV